MDMGRIKTKPIKSAGDRLFEQHGERFSRDFAKNKEILPQVAEVRSKKIRNILAGYLSAKVKRQG